MLWPVDTKITFSRIKYNITRNTVEKLNSLFLKDARIGQTLNTKHNFYSTFKMARATNFGIPTATISLKIFSYSTAVIPRAGCTNFSSTSHKRVSTL